jgi:hypothetical protein
LGTDERSPAWRLLSKAQVSFLRLENWTRGFVNQKLAVLTSISAQNLLNQRISKLKKRREKFLEKF